MWLRVIGDDYLDRGGPQVRVVPGITARCGEFAHQAVAPTGREALAGRRTRVYRLARICFIVVICAC